MLMKFIVVSLLMIAIVTIFPLCSLGNEQSERAIQQITTIRPNVRIDEIRSDPFSLLKGDIQDDILSINVEYSGGHETHVFDVYWNGIVTRSYPGQTQLYIKHNANGDDAKAKINETIQFRLVGLHKPMIIMLRVEKTQSLTVEYGVPQGR